MPKDDHGQDIGVCRSRETYDRYLNWLADHLFHTEISVPNNQLETLAHFEANGGIASAAFWLSNNLGLSIWDTEMIEAWFVDGKSYEQFHLQKVEMWEDLTDDERELFGNPDEEYFTSKVDYSRIGQEKLESLRVPAHILHADIPYRPILAKLLKRVEDRNERIAHLDGFYRNFNEGAAK